MPQPGSDSQQGRGSQKNDEEQVQQLQSVCTFTEILNSKADTDNHGELINKPKGNIPGYEKVNTKEKGIASLSDEDDDSRMSGMESDEDDDMEVELESEELDDCDYDHDDKEDSAEKEANNENE